MAGDPLGCGGPGCPISVPFYREVTHSNPSVKGEEWYQDESVAEGYESKRFSRGGRLIDRREKAAVLEALGPVEDRRVLDIAAGTGRFSMVLAEQGAEVVSVDISMAMLQRADRKRQGTDLADAVTFLRGDASTLPFPDDSFDAVIAMRFFHLVDDAVRFLEELRRVSSSVVIFDTFNRFSNRSLYNWALPMDSQLVSPREVRTWLEAADLALVDRVDDWILPYGFYRVTPLAIARVLRPIDAGVVGLPGLRRLASVSYWTAAVDRD